MMFGITSLFFLAFYFASTTASLYVTKPIADTVFSAGRYSTVSWIDDRNSPSLPEMGSVDIELWMEGNMSPTHVATLATDVDPTRRSQKVWISPTWGPNSSAYYICFVCKNPPLTIYTADFTITAMDDTLPYHGEQKAAVSRSSTSASITSVFSIATSPLVSLSTATTSASSTSGRTTSTSTLAVTTHTDLPTKAKAGASGSLWKRTTVDMERIKFRLVFVLWPLLIGATMAL